MPRLNAQWLSQQTGQQYPLAHKIPVGNMVQQGVPKTNYGGGNTRLSMKMPIKGVNMFGELTKKRIKIIKRSRLIISARCKLEISYNVTGGQRPIIC
ncbi:hypothetical protein BGS_0312 [Beggiatoa sp. SS]|nr:hypothetical protein BGS_0312 [Beggiatoa sp. SS]